MQLKDEFEIKPFIVSETTVRQGIHNYPPPEVIGNLRYLHSKLLLLERLTGVKLIINSGYRSPMLNKLVGGSKTSQHLRGEAADFLVAGQVDLHAFFDWIRSSDLDYDQLIYEGPWLHISFSRIRARRSTLMAYFKAGKAHYSTPDWKPQPYKPEAGITQVFQDHRAPTILLEGDPALPEVSTALHVEAGQETVSAPGSPEIAEAQQKIKFTRRCSLLAVLAQFALGVIATFREWPVPVTTSIVMFLVFLTTAGYYWLSNKEMTDAIKIQPSVENSLDSL